MPKQLTSVQADLFETNSAEPTLALAPAQRTSVLQQLQTLLIEVMTVTGELEPANCT